jgi:hypothetical protein
MTPEEFAAEMRAICTDDDVEAQHWDADALMSRLLRQLGYEEGVAVFYESRCWYA